MHSGALAAAHLPGCRPAEPHLSSCRAGNTVRALVLGQPPSPFQCEDTDTSVRTGLGARRAVKWLPGPGWSRPKATSSPARVGRAHTLRTPQAHTGPLKCLHPCRSVLQRDTASSKNWGLPGGEPFSATLVTHAHRAEVGGGYSSCLARAVLGTQLQTSRCKARALLPCSTGHHSIPFTVTQAAKKLGSKGRSLAFSRA